MTRRFLPGLLAFACLSSGCLHSATTIEVRPDGGGTIQQETAMSSETLDLLDSMGSAKPGEPKPEFFTEAAARKLAATMGATFISGEPFRKANLKGYRARFAFDDISKVRVNLDASGSPLTEAESKDPLFDFSFARGPTSSLLTIQVPQGKPGDFGLPLFEGGTGALESADKAEAAQATAMAKMMNGLKMASEPTITIEFSR
jgi:hypothetical protein